ncbi:MAG: hypothetical protein V3S01_11965 [Dehalococcoidia bacterium]
MGSEDPLLEGYRLDALFVFVEIAVIFALVFFFVLIIVIIVFVIAVVFQLSDVLVTIAVVFGLAIVLRPGGEQFGSFYQAVGWNQDGDAAPTTSRYIILDSCRDVLLLKQASATNCLAERLGEHNLHQPAVIHAVAGVS